MPAAKRRKKQTSSSFMMILLGLSIGLALSLILAIYVIMSPSPFVDKFGVEINSDKNSEVDQSKKLEETESSEFYELLDGSDNDMSNNNDFLNDDENIIVKHCHGSNTEGTRSENIFFSLLILTMVRPIYLVFF